MYHILQLLPHPRNASAFPQHIASSSRALLFTLSQTLPMDSTLSRVLGEATLRAIDILHTHGIERDQSEVLLAMESVCARARAAESMRGLLSADPFGVLGALRHAHALADDAAGNEDDDAASMLDVSFLGAQVRVERYSHLVTENKEVAEATLVGFKAKGAARRSLSVEFVQTFEAKRVEFVLSTQEGDEAEVLVQFEGGWTCETHGFEEARLQVEPDVVVCDPCKGKEHPMDLQLGTPQQLYGWVTGSEGEIPPQEVHMWLFAALTCCPFHDTIRYKLSELMLQDEEGSEMDGEGELGEDDISEDGEDDLIEDGEEEEREIERKRKSSSNGAEKSSGKKKRS